MTDEQLTLDIRHAFGRYHAQAHSIEALATPDRLARPIGTAEPVRPPLLAHRRILGGLSLAGVALAVVLAVAFTFGLTPGGSHPASVWAAWQPTPSKPDEEMQADAPMACAASDYLKTNMAGFKVLIQDRRGPVAFFILGAEGKGMADCLMWLGPSGPQALGVTLGPWPETQGDTLENIGYGTFSAQVDGVQTPIRDVMGMTTQSSVVVTRADGLRVQATVTNGIFAAWWPGDAEPTTVVAYDGAGNEIASQAVAPSETPCLCQIQPASPASPGD